MTASFWTSSSVKVCTADSFERRTEGKAEGFERVVIVLAELSIGTESTLSLRKVRNFAISNCTSIFCATYVAFQYRFFIARRAVQKISTISAEY